LVLQKRVFLRVFCFVLRTHNRTIDVQLPNSILTINVYLHTLQEAAAPYGIESFDGVLRPLWKGIKEQRGKTLAAFLKAIGYIIPLMDASYANYYTREVMVILIREFATTDDEMKKVVLRVVMQSVSTDGVEADYVREEILPEFFRNFWIRRMALNRSNARQVVETTVALAKKVGAADIVTRVTEYLKDEAEPFRKMAMQAIEKVLSELGATDIDNRGEELLMDGVLYAFQVGSIALTCYHHDLFNRTHLLPS
jgi:splicing factor 3B subunit 1